MLNTMIRMGLLASVAMLAAPATAENFEYDFNTEEDFSAFTGRFLGDLADRATFVPGGHMRIAVVPHDANFSMPNLSEETNVETVGLEAAELRYRFRFSPNFEWVRQGKLPGMASFRPHYGGNANQPVAKDSWSHRLMWFPGSPTLKRPDMYIYDQNRIQGDTGRHTTASPTFGFQRNTWYDMRLVTVLNTMNPDGTANSDGKSELWVNNVRAICRQDMKFRGNDATQQALIGRIGFHVYHGGAKGTFEMPTAPDTYVDFDYFNWKKIPIAGIRRTC